VTEQHDDHIWLTAGGSAWAIEWICGDIIGLWRGHWPNLEFSLLNVSKVNWESYCKKCAEMNHARYGLGNQGREENTSASNGTQTSIELHR